MICSDPDGYRPPIYVLVLRETDGTWITDDATFDDQEAAAQAGRDSLGKVYDAWMVLGAAGVAGTAAAARTDPPRATGYINVIPTKKLRSDAEWRDLFRAAVPNVGDSIEAKAVIPQEGSRHRIVRTLMPAWPEFEVEARLMPGGRGWKRLCVKRVAA